MTPAFARLGLATLLTVAAAALVWLLTAPPPAVPVAAGETFAGAGWSISAARLTTAEPAPDDAAPDGSRFVVLEFTLLAKEQVDGLTCAVDFRAGRLAWSPDNAAFDLGEAGLCSGLEAGANRLAYSVTVPAALAGEVVAEVTVSAAAEGELRWFGGETLLVVTG